VVSSEPPDTVVDTVVLRYFLLVDEIELLLTTLRSPIGVPRIVFDPDEGDDIPESARSEITRSIAYQVRASTDQAREEAGSTTARENAERLCRISDAQAAGSVTTFDMTAAELQILSQLTSPSGCKAFGLVVPLGAGEAACIAIAVTRDLVLVTDDNDALRALQAIDVGRPYERIRKLLIRAANDGHISRQRANELHAEMQRAGFWDTALPFPSD
jgi:hypothetical protein